MNYYQSSNFSTVFLLAILFIGMGLLIYFAYDLYEANVQLQGSMEILRGSLKSIQADIEKYLAQIAQLKDDNDAKTKAIEDLTAKNKEQSQVIALLRDENSRLVSELKRVTAENTTLKSSRVEKSMETEKTPLEPKNLTPDLLQITTAKPSSEEASKDINLAHLFDYAMQSAVIALVMLVLCLGCLVTKQYLDKFLQKCDTSTKGGK